ncbi:Tex family protein [Bacillus fonticola]|uniref:Tex family protein n=1 Tax=Bacillus fonticola TaxID=2728853 RepID=UPI0014765D13|nr:Tex family protein [Bacillus fonticola]
MSNLHEQIAKECGVPATSVSAVLRLLNEGNTIPFIARYRKEQTGSLDEVQLRAIEDRYTYITNLSNRKEEVLRLIDEQGKLTSELQQSIQKSQKLQEVEDLYRPFKQKRRTRATVAKEHGLEPLAEWMLSFPKQGDVEEKAASFCNDEVPTIGDAIAGAQDILAEVVSDDAKHRQWIRHTTFKLGKLRTEEKNKEADEKGVFEMYYDYEEPIEKIVPHRVLAMNRGEKEEIIKVQVVAPADRLVAYLEKEVVKQSTSPVVPHVKEAIRDSYKRLIQPAVEREIRNELTEKAEIQAIRIFSENLRNLLLQPPLKGRMVLGVDPAYRTGCKLALVDETGKVMHIGVIYPHPPRAKKTEAFAELKRLLITYPIEMIAIGNGTASRETEQFVVDVIKEVPKKMYYLIVNEAGASVYSASDLARAEFPDLQVEERSAVSIARRLQDPLAELVKIDPKSVGVGQYQHDVSQKQLNDSLTFVVETVVNQVGVNVNTASASLLQYVAGLNKTVATNIIKYREENGKYLNRSQLKKVPRLGAKTYEQSIGFMRILDGDEPLDRTGIHPETYQEVGQLFGKLKISGEQLGTEELRSKLEALDRNQIASDLGIGEITLTDILEALRRPERDPRDDVPKPLLKTDVLQLEDLQEGMELQGTVRNVVDFGAFVDIGVKQDGLVHISKLKNTYVKHPLDVVAVGDIVTVWVEGVDVHKGRVSLTMLPAKDRVLS